MAGDPNACNLSPAVWCEQTPQRSGRPDVPCKLCPSPSHVSCRARYVDQGGGKRKGAFAIYLEPWHSDIFDWLDLRKNHGKEEARCRDLFYGLWVNDLFMQVPIPLEVLIVWSASNNVTLGQSVLRGRGVGGHDAASSPRHSVVCVRPFAIQQGTKAGRWFVMGLNRSCSIGY